MTLRHTKVTKDFFEPYASPAEDCAICKEPLVEAPALNKLLRLHACGHVFHKHCVVPWYAQGEACPVCRRPIAREVTELRLYWEHPVSLRPSPAFLGALAALVLLYLWLYINQPSVER